MLVKLIKKKKRNVKNIFIKFDIQLFWKNQDYRYTHMLVCELKNLI